MKRFVGLFGLVFVLSGVGLLRADSFGSQAGVATCVYNLAGSNCLLPGEYTPSAVAITPHAAWQAASPPDSIWISYRDTGITGATPEPAKGMIPVFAVRETFNASAGMWLNLDVWADDTAGVYLDGSPLKLPNFTQATCANGPIGCEPPEGGHFSHQFALSGQHTLQFDVYQVGTGTTSAGNPMGLLYKGSVPDGGMTLMLLGGALVGLESLRRKFRV